MPPQRKPDCVEIIRTVYEDSQRLHPTDEKLLSASSWAQRTARLQAIVEGNPPGVVGQIAQTRNITEDALRQVTGPAMRNLGRAINKQITKELPGLRYTGPVQHQKWLAAHGDKILVQHPDWFAGKSPQLEKLLADAQVFQSEKLRLAQVLDYPIEAINDDYLEQLWEAPTSLLTSKVNLFPPGRVSVAKERVFADYIEGLNAGLTPKEMSVGELMEHSARLMDKAIADALERRMILERFGVKATSGATRYGGTYREFNNPLYRGWAAPQEIVNFVDQTKQLTGAGTRSLEHVVDAAKNSVFGADFGVFGVQVARNAALGSVQTMTGLINRALTLAHLPHFDVFLDANLPRTLQATTRGGVHVGMGPSIVTPGRGTVLQYVPLVGKYLDKPVTAAIDTLTRAQFGFVLTQVRLLRYEGDLTLLHLLGQNINDPRVLRRAGDWANAATGASRGAMTPGRRAVERLALTSPQMVRAEGAAWMQLANATFNPRATAAERIMGAVTLASFGMTVYGLKLALESAFGDGVTLDPRETFDPRRSDWATAKLKGWNVPLVPQRALVRAIGKSIAALQDGDPDDIARAWTQFAVGKFNPVVSGAAGLAGYGFEPGQGFKAGGLSVKARFLNLAPLPLAIGNILEDKTERAGGPIIASVLGSNIYPERREDVARRVFAEEGIPYNEATWRDIAASPEHPELNDLVRPSEKTEQAIASLEEQTADLRSLAGEFRSRPDEAGEKLVKAYRDWKNDAYVATNALYFETEDREPTTREGRILREIQELKLTRDPETLEPDYAGFEAKRAALIRQMPKDWRDAYAAKLRLPEDLHWIERKLKAADKANDALYEIPRYRGVTTEDLDQVAAFNEQVDKLRGEAQEAGADPTLEEGMREVARREGTPRRIFLIANALRSTKTRERGRNPAWIIHLAENEDVLRPFYPDLYDAEWIRAALGRYHRSRR